MNDGAALRKVPATASAEPIIRFSQVGLTLGNRRIIEDVDLDVAPEEFVSIVGPSGCGKTTLLRMIAGLMEQTTGQVSYKGASVAGPSRDVAFVFQDYSKALLPWRTAAGNVALALEAMDVPKVEWHDRIAALLEAMGLGKDSDKLPRQMSGGMQQRLQIARCLAQEPTVLLMDEPFGALDAITRQGLQDEILALAAKRHVTVVFVTHDLEEAIYLGDRVVGMQPNPGRIVESFIVDLPQPRDQLTTREHPNFLALRHELFSFIKHG